MGDSTNKRAQLVSFLEQIQILDQKEIEQFVELTRIKTLNKGDYFVREGDICREIAFVNSGMLRSYYYSSTEEDITYCLTFKNAMASAYSSFITGKQTPENIQALTDVELLTISKNQILELEKQSHNWTTLFKHFAEQEYLKMEKRIFLLQKETAEKRYSDLLAHEPELLQAIPLNYLSSYLGITQRHLSRIRKSLVY
ncbi:Crp/Fnr family transcriptional regulator [Roseivirga sp.]|uniref:Crp/Fnr family transcriptional regulator n=1 Tax=Roseivirga sp. TaxID=1964215 RepID=UPI003B51F020